MNLILIDRSELSPNGHVTVRDARATHLLRVLHVAPGDTVRIGRIDDGIGVGRVVEVGEGIVTLQCTFDAPPPRPPVDLLLALPRPKVMRRLWAQLAALGVGRIILTNAERVERNYFDTHVLEPACYRPLLIEGLQQARDTHVPLVTIRRQFRTLVEDDLDDLCDAALRLVAHPGASTSIRDAIDRPTPVRTSSDPRATRQGRVLVAVGPEGGWNEFELALLAAHRFVPVGMGTRTLRTDTACVALLAVLADALRG